MTGKPDSSAADLDRLARTIEAEVAQADALTNQADDHVLHAAKAMLEARNRIERGALGPDIRWESWARQNIEISDSWRRELIRIAEADDPKAALKAHRDATRERVQKHRDRLRRDTRPIQTEYARQRLHDYIEGASMPTVRRILAQEFHEIGVPTRKVNRRPPKPIQPKTLANAA